MAKVITVSRTFPKYHPKAGQETMFVEKILKSLNPKTTYYPCGCEKCGWVGMSNCCAGGTPIADTGDYGDALCPKCYSYDLDGDIGGFDYMDRYYLDDCGSPKHHTIRAGKRWKTGDMASIRVWSGKPYNSPQIIIAPDVKLTVFDISIECEKTKSSTFHKVRVNGEVIAGLNEFAELAMNDGLYVEDLCDWFVMPIMDGQILCWNESINY